MMYGSNYKKELPFKVLSPTVQTAPLVFVSPHSGAIYDPDFVASSRLDQITLRRSEDSFVDELFKVAPSHGAPLLMATFPRVYVDPNREPWELDPHMFKDDLPSWVNTSSTRVAGGLGTIARMVTDGAEIYRNKLTFAEAKERVLNLYMPFHKAIQDLLAATINRFGFALLVDCHSMPAIGGPMDYDTGEERADIVLGDWYGTTCSPAITDTAEEMLIQMGYHVTRNKPYAGGFITRNYGRPNSGVHTLQIEIKRSLYMDEMLITKLPKMLELRDQLGSLVRKLAEIDHAKFNHL